MTEQETEAPKEEKNAEFLMPKLPSKKAPVEEKPKVKSAISKLNSMIPPSTENYVAPSWAEKPDNSDHTVEIMNNGVIEARHTLKDLAVKNSSYITIGRMDTCDIHASIPGASRIHCYLQFGDGFDGRGWYIYDKSSTQGTFINKKEVPKGVYYKARAGSIIQITKSNFHLFLEGTDEKIQKTTPAEDPQCRSPEPTFIDELKAKTERSFEKDPLAMLSKFCEREGLEFKFSKLAGDEKEKGFTYAFELPDDISAGNGGSFSGIGADVLSAQRSCALQVCRHLNELDLLNADVQRAAGRNIAANDFYEEDEDTFYDRTGQIEAQRLKRIERHKASSGIKEKALTYPELLNKIKILEDSRQAVTEQLERLVKPAEGVKVLPEELEVSSLNASLSVRLEISKLKRKYEQLSGEINLMQRAAEIAKPFEMKMPTQPPKPVPEQPAIIEEAATPVAESIPKPPQDELPEKLSAKVVEPTISEASTSQESERTAHEPAKPPAKPVEKPGVKKFGLLTRKDLQAQKNAARNKRKMVEDFVDEEFDDDIVDEKRNKTDDFEDPAEIADWVPPKGQTGDGRTSLNDKFGY